MAHGEMLITKDLKLGFRYRVVQWHIANEYRLDGRRIAINYI